MALVGRRQHRAQRDLLVPVRRVDVHPLVVNSDAVVGVAGGERDLHGEGEGVGGEGGPRRRLGACAVGGEVEGEDGGVLEDKVGLGGPEDDPDEEDDEEDEDDEGGDAGKYASGQLAVVVAVMVAAFLHRHDGVEFEFQ